jgi:hypothetical protein
MIKWSSEAWAIVVHNTIEAVEIVTLKFLAGYAQLVKKNKALLNI